MVQGATIFIPDISGYTRFMSKTQLDHNAMILSMLIECLIACNKPEFTVSEIEGDAVLFYKPGAPVHMPDMIAHCLEMHKCFHEKLVEMKAQAPCDCEACEEIHNLTLKFVIHYGQLNVIPIAHFNTATGMDMIIAHRLLKNSIGLPEYILATDAYVNNFVQEDDLSGLSWKPASETYDNIGEVRYAYAELRG
jgi:hypothetical protein